jgi:hypothetical protein
MSLKPYFLPILLLAFSLSFSSKAKISWEERPSAALRIQANSPFGPYFIKASESEGKKLAYEVYSNSCPFDVFYEERKGGLEFKGKTHSTERKKCSFKVFPHTENEEGKTIRIDLVVSSFSQNFLVEGVYWESFPANESIEVKAGEKIPTLEIKAKSLNGIKSISYDHHVEDSCPEGIVYEEEGDKLIFSGRFPQVENTRTCKVTVKAMINKTLIEEKSFQYKIIPRLTDNVFFYWEFFPSREIALTKGEPFGPLFFKAGSTSSDKLQYQIKATNCSFEFSTKLENKGLFISGRVPLETPQKSCYLEVSPFIGNQEGDAQKVELHLKDKERNLSFFKWADNIKDNSLITIRKNSRFPHLEVKAVREGSERVIYLLDKITCSGEFWGRRKAGGTFVIYGEIPYWVGKEECSLRVKAQSKGKEPLFKTLRLSIHP